MAYCSRSCHEVDYPQHKQLCTMVAGRNSSLKAKLYKPRTKLPTEPCAFSEVSFRGAVSIIWAGQNSGGAHVIRFASHIPSSLGLASTESVDQSFQDLQELNVLVRFLLACGPLPNLDSAKALLDPALQLVGGDPTKLRILGAGFTALEWAAKKGNKATVEWLCDEQRTKALVHAGYPVGWAAYAGHEEIIRVLASRGAGLVGTDVGLWNHQSSVLAAASNGKLDVMKHLIKRYGEPISFTGRAHRGRVFWKQLKVFPTGATPMGTGVCFQMFLSR